MKKYLFSLIFLAILTGCAGYEKDYIGYGVVVTPVFYEEVAPYIVPILATKESQRISFFTSSVFKNRETGETIIAGKERGESYQREEDVFRYHITRTPQGHYDLVSWSIGGTQNPYNEKKCGKVGFDISGEDILVLKGVRPAAIGHASIETIIGTRTIRGATFPEFSALPGDHLEYMQHHYSELLSGRKIRVVVPQAENPTAFKACRETADNRFKTISDKPGAIVVSAR
jgi:hypothetical protein